MLKEFEKDREKAKTAEQIVLNTLKALDTNNQYEDVADDRQYFYTGDIKVTTPDGKEYFIEVKDDSRIADTQNILCEEENYIIDQGYYFKGNMYSNGDIYAIVSQQQKKIYILDYKRLKEIYKKGQYKEIPHRDQITYCYLLELCRAKQWGALITTINY